MLKMMQWPSVGVIGLLLIGSVAHAQLRGVRAEVETVVESDRVHASEGARAAVLVRLAEGFHTQSNNPRDPTLIPTVLTIEPPSGVSVEEIVFPPSTDFEQAGQVEPLSVFEHEFAIGVQFALADVSPGTIEVPGRLRYQACDENLCYAPTTVPVVWMLEVAPAAAESTPLHGDIFGGIAFGTGEAPTAAPVDAPGRPDDAGQVENPANLDDFRLIATTGGYLGTDDFLGFISDAESGVQQRGLFEGRGMVAIVLIVLMGGLALNLTPCVLPMIPINLAIIGAGAQAGSRRRGFLLGGMYGAAMAAVYGVLGLIVVLTTGTFGTINASPWFNLAIATVFTVLALAMFDVIVIDFTRFSARLNMKGAARGSFLLAFGMGAVAALLAGACVAPVVIQVVLFSSDLYAKGTAAALALPFLLGVGMAIPWPLAGAGIAALPKPGKWMVQVKQAFGVVILATALYYGYTSYTLFADRWVDAGEVNSSVQEMLKEGWHASLAAGLDQAQREQKPVLVDLWATWCKNCLTMDKTTLKDPDVKRALEGYVKVKYQAEQPDEDPARAVMQRFGAVGLPTYVVLRPTPD
jgi:cytochrome c biogenesis protein CcdA